MEIEDKLVTKLVNSWLTILQSFDSIISRPYARPAPDCNGQVEKQDTSGNERERECESETVDHVIVVVLVFVLESDFKGRTNTNFS